MATDIVERLIQSERGDGIFDRSGVCGEAADEIERLREENTCLRKRFTIAEFDPDYDGPRALPARPVIS